MAEGVGGSGKETGDEMSDTTYRCRKCGAIVEVGSMMVLTPIQKEAMRTSLCRECVGPVEVKKL